MLFVDLSMRIDCDVAAVGLSATEWAKTVVLREPRTVRRWLSGDSPVPSIVIDKLLEDRMR